MSVAKKRKPTGPRFFQLYEWEMNLPAYRHLSCYARCLIMEFRRKHTGRNNGDIGMSCREAARLLGCAIDTASKALKELEEKGWIRCEEKGSFNQKTNVPTKWRITSHAVGLGVDMGETREYKRWKPTDEN